MCGHRAQPSPHRGGRGGGAGQTSEVLSLRDVCERLEMYGSSLGCHSNWGSPPARRQEARGNKRPILQLHRTVSQSKELCRPSDHGASTEQCSMAGVTQRRPPHTHTHPIKGRKEGKGQPAEQRPPASLKQGLAGDAKIGGQSPTPEFWLCCSGAGWPWVSQATSLGFSVFTQGMWPLRPASVIVEIKI